VIDIDILKEAEEIIDNYIKKQTEFSCKSKILQKIKDIWMKIKKLPAVFYIFIASTCGCVAYFLLK